jgi:hypothetical protein
LVLIVAGAWSLFGSDCCGRLVAIWPAPVNTNKATLLSNAIPSGKPGNIYFNVLIIILRGGAVLVGGPPYWCQHGVHYFTKNNNPSPKLQ